MRGIWGILVLLLSVTAVAEEVIKVRLKSVVGPLTLEGYSISARRKASPFKPIAISPLQVMNLNLVKSAPIAKWNIVGHDDAVLFGSPIVIQGDLLQVNGKHVPSPVYLYPQKDSQAVDVVAELDLETYLMGVLPSEMPARWPLEALKAQAVVARSYALARLRQVQNDGRFHLETNIYDQVFKSSRNQNLSPGIKLKLLEAIRETKGEYLVDKRSRPVMAFYHADCGGTTESAGFVWEGSKSYGTTVDRSCPKSPKGRWRYRISKSRLAKRLSKYFGSDKLKGMEVLSKTTSGRNWLMNVEFEGQTQKKVVNTQKLRELVGFLNLKSTKFSITQRGEDFVFTGLGFGHGVGMCQWGAKHLSKAGYSYKQILKKYYPKAFMKVSEEGRVMALSEIKSSKKL